MLTHVQAHAPEEVHAKAMSPHILLPHLLRPTPSHTNNTLLPTSAHQPPAYTLAPPQLLPNHEVLRAGKESHVLDQAWWTLWCSGRDAKCTCLACHST